MSCQIIKDRLVAHRDGELAPGEHALIDRHLHGCAACTALDESLQAASPGAIHDPPPEWAHRARRAMRAGIAEGARLGLREPTWAERVRARMQRPGDISRGGLLLYAALLLGAVAWGAAGWLQVSPPETLGDALAHDTMNAPTTAMPADHVQPASYSPEDGWY